ncbi:hypothetical protein [Hyphobacterium sp.]|uniref:hypothetical protein n=1 Tax=Hyphobacterium sp. TaxID=2004662 RepID=UPI003748A144
MTQDSDFTSDEIMFLKGVAYTVAGSPDILERLKALDVKFNDPQPALDIAGELDANDLEIRYRRIERTVERIALMDFSDASEIEIPVVNTGIEGRLQVLEEKLEAVQKRVDVISLSVSELKS